MNGDRKIRLMWLTLAGLWFVFRPAGGGGTNTATICPDEPNPAPTVFSNVPPEDTVYFDVNIVTPGGYKLEKTLWDKSQSNPLFLWKRITDTNSTLVNTAWEVGTTTVRSHGYWSRIPGDGGEGGGGGGLIHRWAEGVAGAGETLGSALVVKVAPAAAGVGDGVTGSAFGTNVQTGAEFPVKANWSVSEPGYFKNGHTDTHSVSFSSDDPESVQLTAVNNGPPQRSGSESAQFVEVVSITAAPAIVCVGTTPEFTVTTSPGGYTNLVNIAYDPNTPGTQAVVAVCGTSSATCTVTVLKVDFIVESDEPKGVGAGLTDNREATVTISVEGLDDPSVLAFSFDATPVETGNLINKMGTAISFTPTADPLVWRTSKTYWYGVLPDRCCYFNHHAYEFVLTIDGACSVVNEYAVGWPDEDPEMQGTVHWPSTTVIHDAELVPGFTNWYRCLIVFGDFPKSTKITGIPTTCQYAEEMAKEEEYHEKQWMGQVNENQGGQGDCFTAKGIKWMINWVGEGPWYTYGDTPEEARAEAENKVTYGQQTEWDESGPITEADNGYVELKAKEYVGWNAAYKYHCTYEQEYGPNPVNHHHPAY